MDAGLPESCEPRMGGEGDSTATKTVSLMDSVLPSKQKRNTEGLDSTHSPNVTTADPPKGPEDDDDDVVLVEASAPTLQAKTPTNAPSPKLKDCTKKSAMATASMPTQTSKTPPAPALVPAAETKSRSETIVIDDEEDSSEQTGSVPPSTAGGAVPASSDSAALLSSTEPDSEIKIASVTTLGVAAAEAPRAVAIAAAPPPAGPQGDVNLMISGVTSLQSGGLAGVGPGSEQASSLRISNAFSLNPESQGSHAEPSPSRPATFNPGRAGTAREPGQNGETTTHQKPDSWISQSASFPRNQKQPGVDSPAPAASLPKPVASPSGTQQPSRSVKVTCANCKKPLKKGQTAYQRKGSTHLFCSTTCLSAFSHKPAPKKNCAMCKKNITGMKGAIVAQVDSSESFQEFCSTGCLASYEKKQSEPKSPIRTKCSVCGKLTEIRHEVSFKNVTHKICSDLCFNRYRMANGLIMNCCEQCGGYLSSSASANHFLVVDGQQKRFCSQNCVKDYKQTHGKVTSCSGCKSSCSSFDAIHCIGPSGTMEPYCSTACIGKSKSCSTTSTSVTTEPTCHLCKRRALPQYQAALPDGAVYNFCSSSCVTKFQSANVQTMNGQTTRSSTSGSIHLKCCYCRAAFSLKPQTLEWENKVYQFCSATCCEDYKKLHCIVTFCEYCQEEKILHETVKFSGVKKPFCSEGCKLLFKQDFARRLGLKCVTCHHCHQMCKKAATKKVDGVQRDFCSETCAKKFNDWYYKSARCDCCKLQGNLMESVHWRGEMKHFCNQHCLLRFYCQQSEPNLSTQKGPENTAFGYGGRSLETKAMGYSQMAASPHVSGGILKDVKNKAVLCKPLAVSKATYCKPHMKSKHSQTEEVVKKEYVPVPVPTPVYVPVPMNMYAQTTPTPVILPVPVPVPVFLPTTLDSAEEILQTIAKLKAKVPSNPLEADTLEEEEKPNCTDVKCESVENTAQRRGRIKCEDSSSSEEEEEEDDSYQPELDLEDDFPSVPNLVPTVEGLDADIGFTLPLVLGEEKEEKLPLAVKRKGRKRKAVERDTLPPSPDTPSDSRSFPLKSRYGVNAWKRWVLTRIDNSNDVKAKHRLKEVKPVRLKRNLLSLSVAELNDGLSRFVREVRRPNGESYAPDSIFYLCLGIQRHLLDNGRPDDIFSDPSYQLFGEELNKVLKGWQPSVLPDGSLWGRVEEQALWSSQQLGQHSPIALLRSLLYLNTKYFGLRTAEQHLRLSFGKVYGHRKINPHSKATSFCIRIPTISQEQRVKTGTRKRKRKVDYGDPENEPDNDSGNFSHCPIRKHECLLYELYLSKCPTALKNRTDMFYMTPEVTSSLDSPLWYSSTPLERTVLETLLTRILLIKDIYNQRDLSEEEDEEENDVSQ